jgi:hypothetical protein
MMEEIRKGSLASQPTTPASQPTVDNSNNTVESLPVEPVDPAQWFNLNHSEVVSKYPKIRLDPLYRLQSFFAPEDSSAAGMEGNPESLNDLTAGQAEDRFYQ